jgi:hypothetical protein
MKSINVYFLSIHFSFSSQSFAYANDRFDDNENWNKISNQLIEVTNENDLVRSIKLVDNCLYVELPEQLNEESKEK